MTIKMRKVEPKLKKRLIFNKTAFMIAFFLLVFFTIFFMATGGYRFLSSLNFLTGKNTIVGTVISYESTNTTVNGRRLMKVKFKFLDENNKENTGYSFTLRKQFNTKQEVKIIYSIKNPSVSKVEETTYFEAFWLTIIFGFLILIGPLIIIISINVGRRKVKRLERGILTKGVVVDKNRTGTEVNNRYQYELTFKYNDEEGNEFFAKHKTFDPHKLEDDGEESLFYDYEFPEKIILLDDLPGNPYLDEEGNIVLEKDKLIIVKILIILLLLGGLAYYINMKVQSYKKVNNRVNSVKKDVKQEKELYKYNERKK